MLEYVITTDGDKIIISGAYSFSTSKAIEAFGNYIISHNNGIIDGMDQKVSLLASEKFEEKHGKMLSSHEKYVFAL